MVWAKAGAEIEIKAIQASSDAAKYRNAFLIRGDMIFGIPFNIILVLTGNLLTGHFSTFEIQEIWIWQAPIRQTVA